MSTPPDHTTADRSPGDPAALLAELRASREQLAATLNALPDLFFELDADGRICDYRAPRHELLYRDPADFLGRSVDDLLPPEATGVIRAAIADARATGLHFGGTYALPMPDGERWYELSVAAKGERTAPDARFITLVRDITDRKRSEAERLGLERQLLQAQKLESLGVLAGGIAHDFNNLLTVIVGNLDMALTEELPGDVRTFVSDAMRAARRATDLTRQMLAYAGTARFAVARLDLAALVREREALLRASAPHTATLRIEATAHPIVEADAEQIEQVLINLVANAAEAVGAAPGEITVTVGSAHFDAQALAASRVEDDRPAPGTFAYIEVGDTGTGMTPDVANRVFEPFFTTRFTGRGLGMSVVLGIVRSHRGAILIDSTPGRGTRVRVLLPECQPAVSSRGPRPGGEVPATRRSVLVVDDESEVRQLCTALVERIGFEAVPAADGEEGVAAFAREPDRFACVLIDLTMPKMDGVATLGAIRAVRAAVPAILTSGYARETADDRLAAHDAVVFLQKPFATADLRTAFARALDSAEAAR